VDREIVHYLMDIQDRLGTIETKVDALSSKTAEWDMKIEQLETKVTRAEASLKTVRWISGVLLVTIPATAAAIAKILKP
jgi:hypothetical protein